MWFNMISLKYLRKGQKILEIYQIYDKIAKSKAFQLTVRILANKILTNKKKSFVWLILFYFLQRKKRLKFPK